MSILSTLCAISKCKRDTLTPPPADSTLDWAATLVIYFGCNVQDVALALNVSASSLYARRATHQETSPGPPTSEYAPTANEIKRTQAAIANITGAMLSYVPPSIEVLLFPNHNHKAMLLRLLQHLNNTTASTDISMYIAAAILAARGRRVAVRIVTSRSTLQLQGPQMQSLFNADIQIKVNKKKSHVTHHRYGLIDRKTFMNGSFNWTVRALTNSENIIVWTGDPLVNIFLRSFARDWETCEELIPSHFTKYKTTLCPQCVLVALDDVTGH